MVMSLIESLTKIKNAVYGREVREAIHDGVFRANQIADNAVNKTDQTQIRQDNLEAYNDQMIQEMTDKDVISAPEIIQARGGKPTLGARLDEASDKMEQIDDDVVEAKNEARSDAEERAFDLRWNSLLVEDNDWTLALQTALNDSPDAGRTIFIGQDITVKSTIIWPNISGDTTANKAITIEGNAKSRSNGVIGGYQKGATSIEFTGEGALFDLRNGTNATTLSPISIRNINLFGDGKVGTYGINADALMGANLENIQIRNFDVGMRTGPVYYGTFDNLRFFYNLKYGLNVEGEVNHAKFHRCNFSQTRTGTGVRVYYGQTGVVFDGCWFEGNLIGVELAHAQQALFQACYFEANDRTMMVLGHIESGETTINMISSNVSTAEDSQHSPFYTSGAVEYSWCFIGNTIHHGIPSSVLIGGSGNSYVVDINNKNNSSEFNYPDFISLSVKGNDVRAYKIMAGAQTAGDITGNTKKGKMEVFNRNGASAGFVQLYAES